MTFIKYTNDGKAVIQPAALTLSGLEQEETLEMHTLENAIVLLKQEMEPVEKAAAMSRNKKENAAQSTRQLMGIDGIKDYCIATRMGDLVFFIIKPTNISVLSDSSISARIYALLNVVKGQAEIEMLALNSKESFERNKNFYQERMGSEELPAIRRLLEQDSKHLDRIQVLMASSREFYIIIRLRSEKETDVFPYLSRIEQSINDNGFTTRRATEQDLKRMLGVYFEQNVTTEKFEDYDGDRWVIVGE